MKNLFALFLTLYSFTWFEPTLYAQVIKGKVYIDLNSSGQWDNSDYGFGGVQIYLYNGCLTNSPIVDSVRTADDGSYQFDDLPLGRYRVKVNINDPKSRLGSPSPSFCCLELASTSGIERCDFGFSPPNCTTNPYSVDNFCELAYDNALCNLTVIGDFSCGQNPSFLGPWNDSLHCGGKFQNTSFFGFIAGTGSYDIRFTVFDCAGTGLEFGLMDSCDPKGPYIVCSGVSNGGIVTVSGSQLVPGKTYIFWMDGYQGSVCSYYIQVVGDFNYFEIPDINDIKIHGLSENTCNPAGIYNVNFELGPSSDFSKDSISAFWEVERPDGVIEKFTTYASHFDTLAYNFKLAGVYTICVATHDNCSLFGVPFCEKMEVNITENDKKNIKICKSSFPWSVEMNESGNLILDKHGNPWRWEGGDIMLEQLENGQKTFYSTYYTSDSCAYSQIIELEMVDDLHSPIVFCASSSVTSVTFAWTNLECVDNFDIYINGIFVKRQKELSYKAIGLAVGAIASIQVVPISECQCPNVESFVQTCAAQDCGAFPAVMVEQKDFCLSEGKVTLVAKDTSNSNVIVKWSGVGVDSVGVFDPSIAGVGRHEITLKVVFYDVCYYYTKVFINVYDATIGNSCDDNDDTTTNDTIQPDCTCKGEKSSQIHDLQPINLSVMPNPSEDKIQLKGNINEKVYVSITDVNGKVVSTTEPILLSQASIDVSQLPQGMYFIIINSTKAFGSQRFIKIN